MKLSLFITFTVLAVANARWLSQLDTSGFLYATLQDFHVESTMTTFNAHLHQISDFFTTHSSQSAHDPPETDEIATPQHIGQDNFFNQELLQKVMSEPDKSVTMHSGDPVPEALQNSEAQEIPTARNDSLGSLARPSSVCSLVSFGWSTVWTWQVLICMFVDCFHHGRNYLHYALKHY